MIDQMQELQDNFAKKKSCGGVLINVTCCLNAIEMTNKVATTLLAFIHFFSRIQNSSVGLTL